MANRTEAHRRSLLHHISKQRREIGAKSIMAFALTYLGAHFTLAPSPMHLEICTFLESASRLRGDRLAFAAPRNHAKSTIVSLAYLLWCICYGKEPFILLISNTLDQAADFLSQIKRELQSNPRLIEDFPEVCEPPSGSSGNRRWRRDEIITRNDIKVTALGADTKIRGRKHREDRPTLIILDDIENEVEVRSPDQRRRKAEWFYKAVLKAGSAKTNVIVIGTILHYDALLATLVDARKSPGWTGRTYKAVIQWSTAIEDWAHWEAVFCSLETYRNARGPEAARRYFEAHEKRMLKGTKVLWSQREDYISLMIIRIVEGRVSFDSEKQNDPVNPEDCLFLESDFQYWDEDGTTEDQLLNRLSGHCTIVGACDPSMGKHGRGRDDSAIVTLVRDTQKGTLYVLDADIRRLRPNQIIDNIIALQDRRKFVAFAMEANQYQEFLADVLTERARVAGIYVPIRKRTNTTDKHGRIQKLQPHITAGTIRFSRRHIPLLDQLRQFPMGAHDDGPDALEMALEIAGQFFGQSYKVTCFPKPDHLAEFYGLPSRRRDRW